MKKIFRFVSERIPLQWKNLARELPILPDDLIEAEIFQIEEMHRGNLKEQAYRSLIVWETSEPEQCTKEMLITALKDCRLNLVVKELSTQPWI
ncbi:FAS-associated death domain protein-like [Saccoglossus kowalevskii]|uniref:Protein FADD-like n=1 Tax=Saccoglossus kowalevskii TaxID=10224 RepID=A0ABM0MYL5_SACKO|nr:PREDICTED: protein FADD-like [Saccoglossus kowalevskii]